MTLNEVLNVRLGDQLLYGDEKVEVVGLLTRESFNSLNVYATFRVDKARYPLIQIRGADYSEAREVTYRQLTVPKRRLRLYQETLD